MLTSVTVISSAIEMSQHCHHML